MAFPDFYARIPPLTLRDPLAAILGAAKDGILEYRYEDAVRLAGHSCPTVAGAWLMARHGLAALYPNEMPVLGNILRCTVAAKKLRTAVLVEGHESRKPSRNPCVPLQRGMLGA